MVALYGKKNVVGIRVPERYDMLSLLSEEVHYGLSPTPTPISNELNINHSGAVI